MVNAEIRKLRDTIIAVINASPLPIEVKRLVVSEIINNISKLSDDIIYKEESEKENITEESPT